MKFIDNKNNMPSLRTIKAMSKSELKDYLESRGFAVYDDSKKEMLETAISDYNEEHGVKNE